MRILVVGGGGREHALCWKLVQNAVLERLYAAPGNAGMAELATLVPVNAGDVTALVDFAERESIDLTVVGPEAPLIAGLVDEMEARGMAVFGPTRDAARLEGSKSWARRLCERHGIPAARSRTGATFCRWRWPTTTSGHPTATGAPTPAGWAPSARCPRWERPWSAGWW